MKNSEKKNKEGLFSKPLLSQSIKSNLTLWLVLTLGSAAIFIIINLVVGTKKIFTNIDMNSVQLYVQDENMSWLQILGLLNQMGFSLNRIQVMSNLDLNAVMNDLIYKIAGVLLPMIYVMIACNRLVAAQVSDGSMAYILSTPTNRKKVVRTQYVFMVVSLAIMYAVITLCALITGIVAFIIAPQADINMGTMCLRTVLYCFGSLVAMFALTGVCFFASTWCNKSSRSLAIGGGACVCAFLFCILGLFGSQVFVSVGVGVEAMNVFNYLTIYSLVNTDSMSNFSKAVTGCVANISYDWIWELAILIAIGGILAFIGSKKFVKKDLPL